MRSAFLSVALGALAWACFDTSPASAQVMYRRWYYNNYGYMPRQAYWYPTYSYPAYTYPAYTYPAYTAPTYVYPTTTYYYPMPAQPVAPAPTMQPTAGPPAAASTKIVTITDGSFQPGEMRVAPGSTIQWMNKGQKPHTVSAIDGSWDSGNIPPGGSYSKTFNQAGTFAYRCNLHPQMRGSVIVEQGTALAPAATAPRPPY
ncbi:MAG TPA: cupredoxin family copper-binding protein [Gemmataceae bacterium]|nr:cupredoxin family copper-binding protein [Gemmataceae bacterium]